MPAPLATQSESVESFRLAERARISLTSLQPKFGLACNRRAMTPDAKGVADDVPLNLLL